MKILVICDQGSTGGAALAATRLCIGLRRRGHAIGMVHGKSFSPLVDALDVSYPLGNFTDWPGRIASGLKLEAARRFAQRKWVDGFRKALRSFRPDIVSIHNLHGMVWDIEVVEECLRHAPAVWTLHDMWALTGSCAYSIGCRKFESACDAACPQQGVYPTLPAHMVGAAHRRRRRLYSTRPQRFMHVAPSEWLTEESRQMTRGDVSVRRVNYGLDLDAFCPMPKTDARSLLHLPYDERPVFIAAAASFSVPYKGIDTLAGALPKIETPIRLLLLGNSVRLDLPSHIDVRYLGPTGGDRFLAIAYNAADVLIHPSHADNQPLVIMEALSCGTPVIGLPIGGVPEMARDGQAGWIADGESPEALARAIERALSERSLWGRYSAQARIQAVQEYDMKLQALRYEMLFDRLQAGQVPQQNDLDAMSLDSEAFKLSMGG